MQLQLDSRFAAVDAFIRGSSGAQAPEMVKAELYRFATVRICGYIERSIEIIIMERLRSRAHPKVLNFVAAYFKYGKNLDTVATSDLLNRFDSAWQKAFDAFVVANPDVKELVNSCYGLRNTIAHGGNAGVTDVRALQLLGGAKRMIDAVVLATK
ncbi:HEPN domain-containing protein [Sphingopyxis sp.]|uniref:HEPN domain-containing protein n=1 Tax=Sphingopyxis sp. TaxID=1908224 RepID=UPI002FC6D7A3